MEKEYNKENNIYGKKVYRKRIKKKNNYIERGAI